MGHIVEAGGAGIDQDRVRRGVLPLEPTEGVGLEIDAECPVLAPGVDHDEGPEDRPASRVDDAARKPLRRAKYDGHWISVLLGLDQRKLGHLTVGLDLENEVAGTRVREAETAVRVGGCQGQVAVEEMVLFCVEPSDLGTSDRLSLLVANFARNFDPGRQHLDVGEVASACSGFSPG